MKLAIIVTTKRRFSPPSSRTRAASAIPPSNMIQRSIGQRWRSTTLPYLSLRGAGQAAEFVGWIVLARRLGTTAFGELAVATLVCRYGGLVADWGASIAGVRDVAAGRNPAAIRRVQRRRLQSTAIFSVAYIAGCFALGYAELSPLVIVAVSIGLNRDWIALGNERGGRSAAPSAVQGALLLAIALVASTSAPTLAVAVAYGAGLVMSITLNPLPPLEPEGVDIDHVDNWMLLAVISNQVMSSADTIFLAIMASASTAGIYAAIYRFPNAWLAALVIVRGSLLPIATSVRQNHPEQFHALRTASLRWGARAALVLVLITPVVYWAVPIVFGQEYSSGQWPAVILVLATAVATAAAPLHHLFLAFDDDDKPYGLMLLVAAGVNVVLMLVGIPLFDMVGAACATLAANVVLALVLLRGVKRREVLLPQADRS